MPFRTLLMAENRKRSVLIVRVKYSHTSLVKTKIRIGKKWMLLMTRC